MKQMLSTTLISLLVCGIVFIHISGCGTTSRSPLATSDSSIVQAIVNNNWVFTANFVIPQGGRSRQTNDLYTVNLAGNVLAVTLPYFGRAYGGGLLTNQSPLNFTSKDFSIDKEKKESRKWSIVIKPKDYMELQSLNFDFFESGSATLNVTLTSRSAISFNGFVTAGKASQPGN